jgi:hypothetical protein
MPKHATTPPTSEKLKPKCKCSAPGQPTFKEAGNQHDAGERIAQYRGVATKQPTPAAAAGLARPRINGKLENQTGGGKRE